MYVSDGCTVQFRLGFVFNFLRYFQKDVALELHYNEAHHGKGLMDGIGGIIKNLVYRKVLSRDVVFDTPKKFAGFANEISNVDFLFFWKNSYLQKVKKSQRQHKYQQPRIFTRLSWWRRGIRLKTSFVIWVRAWSPFLLKSMVYNMDTKQRVSPTKTFATIVKMNMSRVKNGFSALYVLTGTIESVFMNRSWTFASGYFISSALIITRSWSDFSYCILYVYTSLSITFWICWTEKILQIESKNN